MTRVACLLGVLLSISSASADPVLLFSEFDDGEGNVQDLSNNPLMPTSIGVLPIGEGEVLGAVNTTSTFPEDADADIFTFNVADNTTLDSVVVTISGSRHFFGLDDGNTSDSGNGTQLLIATLISGTTDNLLDLTNAQQTFGGQGAGGQLGPGDYTIWVQENSPGFYDYSIILTTSAAAIPEPSSAIALLALASGLVLRRRR